MTGRKTFDLYKSGVVVDLSIGTWLASTRLDPKDLGLSTTSTTHRDHLIWLGRKRLVRKGDMKPIRKVINRATNHLYSHSFAFPFGQVQFVTFKKLEKMIQVMEESERDFWIAVDEFISNYDKIRAEVLEEYSLLFTRILREKGLDEAQAAQRAVDEDQLIVARDLLLKKLEEKYPSKAVLREKFRFDFVIFEVASPKFKGVTAGGAREAAESDQIFREKLDKKVDGFLDGVMGQLKGMAVEMVDYMSKRIDSNKVNFKSISAFQRYVESFKEMNFADWSIQGKMEELGKKLSGISETGMKDEETKRDLSDAVAELKKEIVGTTSDAILGEYRLLNLGEN
jgi:hypothetical protein